MHRIVGPVSIFVFSSRLRRRFRYCRTLLVGRRCVRLENRSPLISLSFDDFPRSALEVGGGILEEYGLGGTYYAALGLMNTDAPVGRIFSERDLDQVVIRGHELGCHTFDHCDAWKTQPRLFEESILRNQKALNRLSPAASFSTLSYPLTIPRPQTKRRAERYFSCCRGGGAEPLNSGTADLNFLNASFLEKSRGDAGKVKALIDRNSRSCGWLILATHDVADSPSPYGCTPGFFQEIVQHAVGSGATILPVAAALMEACGTAAHAIARRPNKDLKFSK